MDGVTRTKSAQGNIAKPGGVLAVSTLLRLHHVEDRRLTAGDIGRTERAVRGQDVRQAYRSYIHVDFKEKSGREIAKANFMAQCKLSATIRERDADFDSISEFIDARDGADFISARAASESEEFKQFLSEAFDSGAVHAGQLDELFDADRVRALEERDFRSVIHWKAIEALAAVDFEPSTNKRFRLMYEAADHADREAIGDVEAYVAAHKGHIYCFRSPDGQQWAMVQTDDLERFRKEIAGDNIPAGDFGRSVDLELLRRGITRGSIPASDLGRSVKILLRCGDGVFDCYRREQRAALGRCVWGLARVIDIYKGLQRSRPAYLGDRPGGLATFSAGAMIGSMLLPAAGPIANFAMTATYRQGELNFHETRQSKNLFYPEFRRDSPDIDGNIVDFGSYLDPPLEDADTFSEDEPTRAKLAAVFPALPQRPTFDAFVAAVGRLARGVETGQFSVAELEAIGREASAPPVGLHTARLLAEGGEALHYPTTWEEAKAQNPRLVDWRTAKKADPELTVVDHLRNRESGFGMWVLSKPGLPRNLLKEIDSSAYNAIYNAGNKLPDDIYLPLAAPGRKPVPAPSPDELKAAYRTVSRGQRHRDRGS